MSVRATERLIGDVVIVSALQKSPPMVVKAIDEETKLIATSWFSDHNVYQEGVFPANALDRVEQKPSPKTGKTTRGRKPAR